LLKAIYFAPPARGRRWPPPRAPLSGVAFAVPKRKYTVEEHLDFVRWFRDYEGLKNRESKHYLKELRRERGLTQKQLAERAGVSQQYVSRIESNCVNVGPKTVGRLASALEMDPLELTLLEVLYRDTLLLEEYDNLKGVWVEVEDLDVGRWTLREALSRGGRSFYPTWNEYDEQMWGDSGVRSQEEADRANAAMRRLRERYGVPQDPYEDDW
jgi:transcriptional regulator with XRE-family HTH domain